MVERHSAHIIAGKKSPIESTETYYSVNGTCTYYRSYSFHHLCDYYKEKLGNLIDCVGKSYKQCTDTDPVW